MFSRKQYEVAIAKVATQFEKTAPTVCDWCDFLSAAKDHEVTLADLQLLNRLATEDTQANYAANLVYHLIERSGKSTAGQAGF